MSLVTDLIEVLDDKQGQDIAILDMRKVSPFMDYMLVTHVSNPRLLNAVKEHVLNFLDENNVEYSNVEGTPESKWLLIDAKEVVVHLFLEEERGVYNLEKLWQDCLVERETLES